MDQDKSGTITLMELYKFIMRVSKMDNPDATDVSRLSSFPTNTACVSGELGGCEEHLQEPGQGWGQERGVGGVLCKTNFH